MSRFAEQLLECLCLVFREDLGLSLGANEREIEPASELP